MKKLDIVKRKYKSGFKGQVVRLPHFEKKFIGVIVDFGGSDKQKLSGGAHFLEHKLFAKSYGDISHKFEELNATTNAFTSYNETMFYAEFIDHWRKILPLLFELVGTTHFTKENVAKESKIIDQELAMYQDEPSWQVNHSLLEEMFPKSKLAQDLTSTHESLKKMTPEILKAIYDNHYVAENMSFVACGGFTEYQAKEILSEVNKLQEKYLSIHKKPKQNIKIPKSNLDNKDQTITGNVTDTHVGIGIKLPDLQRNGFTNSQAQLLLEMMLEIKFGDSSTWFEEQQKSGVLRYPLSTSVSYTRQGNFILINGISNSPDILIDKIKTELKSLDVRKEEFSRQKKNYLAHYLRQLNDVQTTAIEQAELSLDDEKPQNLLEILQILSFNEFCNFYNSILSDSDIFTTILKNEKGLEE